MKIAPQYSRPVIHVKDASRCVGVLSNLLSAENGDHFTGEIRNRYAELKVRHENRKNEDPLIRVGEARSNGLKADWSNAQITRPTFTGIMTLADYPLDRIAGHIDWTFFFHAWKIPGKYPEIFDDPVKGEEARKLYDDARAMLSRIVDGKMLQAQGVFGFFPALSVKEDVFLFEDDERNNPLATLHFLRNQEQKRDGVPNLSLADFIAPSESGRADYIGLFAVTAGIGIEKWVKKFEDDLDDYSAIMIKVLADRLAEAFAEELHERVRKEFWGYAPEENLSVAELLKEEYRGIRPAPGYPACPEHSEKRTIFDLLGAEKNAGITLTENYAMYPAASVSGYYFSHEFSRYFNLGKISPEQVEDYATRKNISFEQAKKYLRQNIKDE